MNWNKSINVGDREISESVPVFIIAEAGVNHGGDMGLARKLVDVAVEAGADAVKFQAFRAENLILKTVEKAPYQKNSTHHEETQFNMLKKLELQKDQYFQLRDYCSEKGILFLITPFDEGSLDELDDLDLPGYKISSTDLTNLPFLRKVASRKKPIFLSTGMSYFSEVKKALEEINDLSKDVILLACTANYPIMDDEANLRVVKTFMEEFGILTGYSDHTVGSGAAPYAVPLGAVVVEKHFTTDKNLPGPDHKASLTPEELKDFVKTIRRVEKYLGSGEKKPTDSEMETRASLQKCLVARKSIRKGELFTESNIVGKRTGGVGISPLEYRMLVGRQANKDYSEDEIISLA